jgi:hypothetical protein
VDLFVGWRLLNHRTLELEPGELTPAAFVASLALFLPIGMAAAWLLSVPLWGTLPIATAGSLGFFSLLELALGVPVHAPHLALAALFTMLGVALGWWDRRRADEEPRMLRQRHAIRGTTR